MRGDLAVRVNDGYTDRVVTGKTTGLRFRKTAPGGHADASCRISLPVTEFPNLGPTDRLYISDARNGRVLFDGYTNNPGAETGPAGEGFDLSALGGQSRLSDQTRPLVYIDTELQGWSSVGGAPSASTTAGDDPTGSVPDDGLVCQFNPGQPIGTGSTAPISYLRLKETGMEFGAIGLRVLDGKNDPSNYDVELAWSPAGGSGLLGLYNGNDSAFTRYVGDTDAPPAGQNVIRLRLRRTGGATNIIDDDTWAFFYQVRVLGRRMDRNGTLVPTTITGMLTTEHVLASWVVEDLLGRVLNFCDPNTAVVEDTTYQIDQLAYDGGVKPMQVLDDLTEFEPDMVYLIGETGPTGLHRFEYRAWPTEIRYVIPPSIPFTQPGGDFDQCNRVSVSWIDKKGDPQVTVVTSTVEALDRVGRVRDADSITLPEGRGSTANAQRIGAQVLAAKATAPKSGTCVIDRPILDLMTGAMVERWEIEPGYLAQVMATGDVLRLTEMEYTDDSCTTTVTLGEPILSIEQRIARLRRVAA